MEKQHGAQFDGGQERSGAKEQSFKSLLSQLSSFGQQITPL
jgi:hypothetical protein